VAAPVVELLFPHTWVAEILPARPLILPQRSFVYPQAAEEVERGALEVLIRPAGEGIQPGAPRPDSGTWDVQPFLATCALGFRDPSAPTGLWSAPNPDEICAVSGGYVYLIDTTAPERFTMLPLRPVMQVQTALEAGLLLFAGHHSILAWGREGLAWQSGKLSDEGVTITGVEGETLHGMGWKMMTDRETPFALDLKTGKSMA
jgi:hypothetical protein